MTINLYGLSKRATVIAEFADNVAKGVKGAPCDIYDQFWLAERLIDLLDDTDTNIRKPKNRKQAAADVRDIARAIADLADLLRICPENPDLHPVVQSFRGRMIAGVHDLTDSLEHACGLLINPVKPPPDPAKFKAAMKVKKTTRRSLSR